MRSLGLKPLLGRQHFLLLVALALLPAIMVAVLDQLQRRNTAMGQSRAMALQVAQSIAHQHATAIQNGRQLLYALSQADEVQNQDIPGCTELFAGLMSRSPSFTLVSLADTSGRVIASGGAGTNDNVTDRRFFAIAKGKQEFAVGDYVIGRRSGKPTVHLAQPVFDHSGKLNGVVFVGLDMAQAATAFTNARLPDGSHMIFADAVGAGKKILYAWPNPGRWVGHVIPEDLDRVLPRLDDGETQFVVDIDGDAHVVAGEVYRPTSNANEVAVIVAIPLAAARAGEQWIAARNIAGAVLAAVLFLVGIWYLRNALVTSQVKKLVTMTHGVADGDLGRRTGMSYEDDDVGTLAKALDSMAISLEEREAQREIATDSLRNVEASLVRRNEQLHVLSAAAQQINTVLQTPVILRQLVACAIEVTGATAGGAGTKCGDEIVFSEYNNAGTLVPIEYRFLPGQGVPGFVLQTREAYLSNDAENDAHVVPEIQQALKFYNLIDIPILSRSAVLLGCFEIHNKPGGFDETDMEMLKGLAASAAIAIENAEAVQARQRSLEATEAANRAKDRFIATLSHELRTPLTPVLATLSSLRDAPGLPPELVCDIAMMRENIELEARLIDDLLDLTRIGKGKLRMEVQLVDAHAMLEHAIAISTHGQSEVIAICADLKAQQHHVRADPARLQQVFWNIVKNAIQYTPPDGSLTICSHNLPSGELEIYFTDTGIGIDKAMIGRVFDAFEQGEITGARRRGSLGLGLAISRAIMQMLGGSIEARSDGPGKGSTFVVRLPVAHPEAAAPDRSAPPCGQLSPLRILLVEDHESTRTILSRLLRRKGHIVETALDAATALAAGRNQHFDLLISDIGLPDGSGLDVMRWFQQYQQIAGIALSGYGMDSDVQASSEAGFHTHLVKPLDADRLIQAIEQVFSAHIGRGL